jgi:hypothetical protein
MKLYTEEQVRKMLENTDKFTPLHIDYLIKDITPIELPSDEEIENYARLSGLVHPFVSRGAKWMRDKIQGGNK